MPRRSLWFALCLAGSLGRPAAAVPVLTLTKIPLPPAISAGDTAMFEILVSNSGTTTASAVTVTDALPSAFTWGTTTGGCSVNATTQVLTCSYSGIPAGATIPVVVSAPTSAAQCGTYMNTASATSSNAGSPSSNTVSLTVGCPSLAVIISSDVFRAIGGDAIGYRVAVSNGGNGTARSVTATGLFPSGFLWNVAPAVSGCSIDGDGQLTCIFGDLGAGEARAVHVQAATDPSTCGHMAGQVSASTTNGGSANAFDNITNAPSGDVDASCTVAIGDVFYLINFLFAGGAFPQ